MRDRYPQFAIETCRVIATRHGWDARYGSGQDEIATIGDALHAIAAGAVLSDACGAGAAIVFVRRRKVMDSDWLEAAALVAVIVCRQTRQATEAEQQRAAALIPLLPKLAEICRNGA